jgi:hypothetical protein
MTDQADRIVRMHGAELARNLLGRLALVDQLAPHQVMKPAPRNQLAPPPAPLSQRPVRVRVKPRAIRLGGVSSRAAPPQFSPPMVEARHRGNAPIAPRLTPCRCSAKITPRSSPLRCLYRLSIATSHALRALGVALET